MEVSIKTSMCFKYAIKYFFFLIGPLLEARAKNCDFFFFFGYEKTRLFVFDI
jgi:hypothetical protein